MTGILEVTEDVRSWPQYFHQLTGLVSQTDTAEYSPDIRRTELTQYLENNTLTWKDIAKAAYVSAETSVLEKLVKGNYCHECQTYVQMLLQNVNFTFPHYRYPTQTGGSYNTDRPCQEQR